MHILKKHNLEDIIKNDYTLKFSNMESIGVNYMEKLLTLSVYYDHLNLSLILGASYTGKVLFHVIIGN